MKKVTPRAKRMTAYYYIMRSIGFDEIPTLVEVAICFSLTAICFYLFLCFIFFVY